MQPFVYINHFTSTITSTICFGGLNKGVGAAKQRMLHRVKNVISRAYKMHGLSSPLGGQAHSTRGVDSSQASFKCKPLEDICVAITWASAHYYQILSLLHILFILFISFVNTWADVSVHAD